MKPSSIVGLVLVTAVFISGNFYVSNRKLAARVASLNAEITALDHQVALLHLAFDRIGEAPVKAEGAPVSLRLDRPFGENSDTESLREYTNRQPPVYDPRLIELPKSRF